MATPKLSAANRARKAAKAAASTTTPAPLDPAGTPAPLDPAGTPAPKPPASGRAPSAGSKVTQRMRAELVALMQAADPNADVSAVSTMDVSTLGAALDQARNPDPISTDADLGDLPPDPIVVPKKGRRKPKAAAASTTPAPIEPAKKKPQPRDPAKQTYAKPTGPLPEAPQRKPKATTSPGDEGPPPPVTPPEAYVGKNDPFANILRSVGKGLYGYPIALPAAGVAGLYALNKLAQMGAAPPPAPPGGAPPMPPMPPMQGGGGGGGPPGGTPPVPFFPVGEEEEEDERYPPEDYRRYLPKQ
jgi:translation initiation factor IF-2